MFSPRNNPSSEGNEPKNSGIELVRLLFTKTTKTRKMLGQPFYDNEYIDHFISRDSLTHPNVCDQIIFIAVDARI